MNTIFPIMPALLLISAACFAVPLRAEEGALDQTGTQWTPYLEWRLENPGWEGNPFDLEATATFTHAVSGETRRTGLFYDGGDTWRFRFTGTPMPR